MAYYYSALNKSIFYLIITLLIDCVNGACKQPKSLA